ncbi:hypothetical protein FNU76_06665 [Chitinimonas arctica]|uniref:Uncharacterized protein n=1 Tax=Chitinimonas arctica TaxID=2594795 RepID=A0A516SD23_9NEIS|nr:hypothetical protein [Chitinimonas arctica]QDQ26055.1 hypothetical protein FNU76_06665 [Chitinimonas arctica]
MFDCLDLSPAEFESPSADAGQDHVPSLPALDANQLDRRYAGRSWLHMAARKGRHAKLARAREVALYLDAEVQRLDDGSLLVLGLSLTGTLLLSERFGDDLAIRAQIAGERG